MILPESSGWANLKSKATCCQAATNLADRDWELLLRIDYKPHPNCTTFTKLGYPVFLHIQVDVALSLAKNTVATLCSHTYRLDVALSLANKCSAIHLKIGHTTLQIVVLWDDCHSECRQVLWFVKVLSVWFGSICLYLCSFVGWLSLRMSSSAVICQSAFCVIWIHMLISVYTCVSL